MSLEDDLESLRSRVWWFEMRPHHPEGWSITVRQPSAMFEVDALIIADTAQEAVDEALERYPKQSAVKAAKKAAAASRAPLVKKRA